LPIGQQVRPASHISAGRSAVQITAAVDSI
jgi:hypothetical protein